MYMAHRSRHAGTEHNCRRPWRTPSLSSQITSYCSLMSIKLPSWRTSASVKKPNVTPVTCTVVTSLDTCALMLLPAALYLPSHHLLHARLLRMSACTAGGGLHACGREAQDAATVCIPRLLIPRNAFTKITKPLASYCDRSSTWGDVSYCRTPAAGLDGSGKDAGSFTCATSGIALVVCRQSHRLQPIMHLLTMRDQR